MLKKITTTLIKLHVFYNLRRHLDFITSYDVIISLLANVTVRVFFNKIIVTRVVLARLFVSIMLLWKLLSCNFFIRFICLWQSEWFWNGFDLIPGGSKDNGKIIVVRILSLQMYSLHNLNKTILVSFWNYTKCLTRSGNVIIFEWNTND